MHHVVERFAPQLRRGAQPLGVTGERLEQERHRFRGAAVAELRQLPARHVDHRAADGARAFMQGRALLLEAARGPQGKADVAGRIDEQRQGPRSFGEGRLRVDPQAGRRRGSYQREDVAHRRPGLARRELRVGQRGSRQPREVGAAQPVGRDAEVADGCRGDGARPHLLGGVQRRLGELRQIGDRDSVRSLFDGRPALQAERGDRLVHRRVAGDREGRERLRRLRFRLGQRGALLRIGFVPEQPVEIAFAQGGPGLSRRGERELRARALQRIDLRSGRAGHRKRRQLLREQAERDGIGTGRARGRGVDDVDRFPLQQPRVLRQRARRQRAGPGGPARPEELALRA